MKILAPICLLICIITSCQDDSDGFKNINPSLKFKLITFSDNEIKASSNSLVQFSWTISSKNQDSLYSLYQDRLFIKLDSIIPKSGLQASLCLLKQGEKGEFIFPIEQLEKQFLKKVNINLTSSDNKEIIHQISIDKIFNEKEFISKKQQFLDWINTIEPVNFNSIEHQIIDNYIDNNELQMETSETGLRYKVYANNSSIKTGYGKHVKIKYTGGTLGLKKNHLSTVQDFYIGEEMQVIRAIEEIILHMEQADSALIIAPSNLAFGDKGSTTGIIPASSPVIYTINLISCE